MAPSCSKKKDHSVEFEINPFTAVYKCTQYAGGKHCYFDFIMLLHIISFKIITTVGIYTIFFPACLRHFGTMSETMFSRDSMPKKKIPTDDCFFFIKGHQKHMFFSWPTCTGMRVKLSWRRLCYIWPDTDCRVNLPG